MAPRKASSTYQAHVSGKLMKAIRKGSRAEDAICNLSDDYDIEPEKPIQSSYCSCYRRPYSEYALLDDKHDFEVDVPDILEDYLRIDGSAAPPSLTLDTWDGAWTSISHFKHDDMVINIGTSVMLKNGTFLRIKEILQDVKFGETVVRGYRLIRACRLQPILDDGTNEMELLLDYIQHQESGKPTLEQSLVDVPSCRILQPIQLRISNCQKSPEDPKTIYFCRWKLTRYYQKPPGKKCRGVEVAIERIRFGEADPEFSISDEFLRCAWRDREWEGPSHEDSYTALDGFCCGGGWSRGAEMAGGVKVVRSFDLEETACKTYRLNFHSTNCLEADVFQYCLPENLPEELKEMATTPEHVDIAHYSTPCQFFSPAHTRPGPNDDKNVAASFCLGHLLDKDRPRIVTFENTSGLERQHFSYLKAIFGQVTSKGYSLRFATLRLANYGLPQDRRRLIMLAACPGEILPTFPLPTHSENGERDGLLDWVTPAEILKRAPDEGWPNHFPSKMKPAPLPKKSRRLFTTLTCSNSPQEVHPDGRKLTLCEYQLLQGFPLHHRFARGLKATQIRAQIGNAFPPSFVKQLVRHIRKQLQKSDGLSDGYYKDEDMSPAQEINQFLLDSEKLPEGERANVVFVDYEDDDEQQEEEEGFATSSSSQSTSTSQQENFLTSTSMGYFTESAFKDKLDSSLEGYKPKRLLGLGELDSKDNNKRPRTTSSYGKNKPIIRPTFSLPQGHDAFSRFLMESSPPSLEFPDNSFSTSNENKTSRYARSLSIRPRKQSDSPVAKSNKGNTKGTSIENAIEVE